MNLGTSTCESKSKCAAKISLQSPHAQPWLLSSQHRHPSPLSITLFVRRTKPGKERETIYLMLSTSQLSRLVSQADPACRHAETALGNSQRKALQSRQLFSRYIRIASLVSESPSCSISCSTPIWLLRDLPTYGTLLSLINHNKAWLGKRRITLNSARQFKHTFKQHQRLLTVLPAPASSYPYPTSPPSPSIFQATVSFSIAPPLPSTSLLQT
jgi:hypothetical protein